MAEEQLKAEILMLSESTSWNLARQEWGFIHAVNAPKSTCLCGHHPITEVCTLLNTKNGNYAEVGNCCVKKFLGIDLSPLRRGVERIRKNPHASIGTVAFEHYAKSLGTVDRSFYSSTVNKRVLSPRQAAWRADINNKILRSLR